jgi:hypothetical protein
MLRRRRRRVNHPAGDLTNRDGGGKVRRRRLLLLPGTLLSCSLGLTAKLEMVLVHKSKTVFNLTSCVSCHLGHWDVVATHRRILARIDRIEVCFCCTQVLFCSTLIITSSVQQLGAVRVLVSLGDVHE